MDKKIKESLEIDPKYIAWRIEYEKEYNSRRIRLNVLFYKLNKELGLDV